MKSMLFYCVKKNELILFKYFKQHLWSVSNLEYLPTTRQVRDIIFNNEYKLIDGDFFEEEKQR